MAYFRTCANEMGTSFHESRTSLFWACTYQSLAFDFDKTCSREIETNYSIFFYFLLSWVAIWNQSSQSKLHWNRGFGKYSRLSRSISPFSRILRRIYCFLVQLDVVMEIPYHPELTPPPAPRINGHDEHKQTIRAPTLNKRLWRAFEFEHTNFPSVARAPLFKGTCGLMHSK